MAIICHHIIAIWLLSINCFCKKLCFSLKFISKNFSLARKLKQESNCKLSMGNQEMSLFRRCAHVPFFNSLQLNYMKGRGGGGGEVGGGTGWSKCASQMDAVR